MPHLINLANSDIDSEYNLEGYDCIGADGETLGDIDGVIVDADSMQPRYVVVDAGGWFNMKQFVVPAGDISRIDEDDRHVYFNTLTKQMLESGRYPRYDDTWWDRNAHAELGEYERGVASAYQPDRRSDEAVDYDTALYQRRQEGVQRLQLLEERLRVDKERYQAGEVRLGKRITERTETVSVPVREERVVIERTPVSGEARAGEITETNETLEVPVMRERAEVEKETVVAEEVGVRKEAMERTERVQETVRHEELEVEDSEGLTTESGRTTAVPYEHEHTGGTRRD